MRRAGAQGWKALACRPVAAGEVSRRFRDFVRAGVARFVTPSSAQAWRRQAAALRRELLRRVYLWGYPRSWIEAQPRVVWGQVLRPHRAYVIRKLRYEVLPGYWSPALLYEPVEATPARGRAGLSQGKLPGVVNVNGHHSGGKAVLYKQARCINLAKRGMLALNLEFAGMAELGADLHHNDFAFLDWVGLAGVGLHYLNMKRGLDVLLSHRRVDRQRVCMTGMSGGGWQTVVLGALDQRITTVVPVAGYNSLIHSVDCPRDRGDYEQSPPDLAAVADYTHLTALLAPRPTLLILNEFDDCCFKTADAKPWIYDRIKPTFKLLGAAERFECYSNTDPGTHNYGPDNRARLYRFLNEQWGLSTPERDLPYESELQSEPALRVGLPAEQRTVRELAYQRGRELARGHRSPRTAGGKRALRRRLAQVLRLRGHRVSARLVAGDRRCGNWLLRVGPHLLPTTARFARSSPRPVLLLCDDGRDWYARHVGWPREGSVAAVDLLGDGDHAHELFLQMRVDTNGHRLLGERVGQVLASAGWLRRKTGARRIEVRTWGTHASVAAALAVGLRPGWFATLDASDVPETLCRFFEHQLGYAQAQRSLCRGLLAVADMPQVLSLGEGVTLRKPGWCVPDRRLGGTFDRG